ncbi:hypothetical protein AX16_005362 [Volvariella volvacea WC 439]|nr:hypothetical protein AX16_005362 [Volvariella volvacea WC 439]
MSSQSVPEHLNSTGCEIRYVPGKGRGVFASRRIAAGTAIEISPVLFFSKDEYEKYGRHTILDSYTFNWMDGRMALALGLGSLFNHSTTPNVSYTRDNSTESIRYTTARCIEAGEELCIFYGHNLWFEPAEAKDITHRQCEEEDDGWGGLSSLAGPTNPFIDDDQNEILPDEQLPFVRYKLPPEEEDAESMRTIQAWVVDIPESQHIAAMLKWLKQAGLDTPELGHLKRIRKQDGMTTILLATSSSPPALPLGLNLPDPYLLTVPFSSALTPTQLALKSALWPTVYTPRRKGEVEGWTRLKARWAWDAMRVAVQAAVDARDRGELPIGVHVPAPYGDDEGEEGTLIEAQSFTAFDTRTSTRHPLRHAALNVVRRIADHPGTTTSLRSEQPITHVSSANVEAVQPRLNPLEPETKSNSAHYLLTGLTLFITHEPCIMCSMALLHSRVKEVVYLHQMKENGGCGGDACLPTLQGVNHRFGICMWKGEDFDVGGEDILLPSVVDV